jgi:hypothetical protein
MADRKTFIVTEASGHAFKVGDKVTFDGVTSQPNRIRGLLWVVLGWLVVILVTAATFHFIVNRI